MSVIENNFTFLIVKTSSFSKIIFVNRVHSGFGDISININMEKIMNNNKNALSSKKYILKWISYTLTIIGTPSNVTVGIGGFYKRSSMYSPLIGVPDTPWPLPSTFIITETQFKWVPTSILNWEHAGDLILYLSFQNIIIEKIIIIIQNFHLLFFLWAYNTLLIINIQWKTSFTASWLNGYNLIK